MQARVPAPGSLVWIRQQRWRVERARRYRHVLRVDAIGRDGRCSFLAPFDRLGTPTVPRLPPRVRPQQFLARLAAWVGRSVSCRSLAAAIDAKVEILSYQLEPVLALISGARGVLIADEVGLGKTIQAGLAIAELQRREPSDRTLVVVPAALRWQWTSELRAHFGIDAVQADADGLEQLVRSAGRSDIPWTRPGVWLASIDYLKQPHVLPAASHRPWDLLVVDEAHGVCGSSERHAAAEALACRSRRVLLLTATPHTGDETRFERLLGLGALPGLDDALVAFRRTRHGLGLQADRRVRWHSIALTKGESGVLSALGDFERAVLRAAGETQRPAALLLLSVFRKRALSTAAALARSIDRRLSALDDCEAAGDPGDPPWGQGRLSFDEAEEDSVSEDERLAVRVDSGLERDLERSWLHWLRELTQTACQDESKLRWVGSLAARTSEPLVVFTEFRDSLDVLASEVRKSRTVAVLHGGLTKETQQAELARFLCGHASALLATDVASQGLNLQSRCRWVLNLELPWNPARVEQRAGRVDRIGQRRPVHVDLLVARHAAEDSLLASLVRRILLAQRSLGASILCLTPPDEQLLRAHLIAGEPLDRPTAPRGALTFCRSWIRPARSEARRVAWRRALSRLYRAELATSGSCRTHFERLPFLRAQAGGGLLFVFSVPLVEGSGVVVEQRIVALRVQRRDIRRVLADVDTVTALGQIAARLAEPRARRLNRWLRSEAGRKRSVERALSNATPGRQDVQPGLFDLRAVRAAQGAALEADRRRRALDDRLALIEAGASVTVGIPALEFVAGPAEP